MSKTEKTMELNDKLRTSFFGTVASTKMVCELPIEKRVILFKKVREFSDWNKEDDPYSEHDFGAIKLWSQTWFWKIDYYNLDNEMKSEDPSDETITRRVLTIMNGEEY